MSEAEQRGVDYLFKLKKSILVKKLILQYHCKSGWEKTHESFEAFATELKLITWKTARLVVIVRRRLGKGRAHAPSNALPHQLSLVEPAEDLSASNTKSW